MKRRVNPGKHQRVWKASRQEDIPVGWHIHHMDGDYDNNTPDNLLCVTREIHREIHEVLYERYGDKKDMHSAFLLGGKNSSGWNHTEEAKKKMSEKAKLRGNNGVDVNKAIEASVLSNSKPIVLEGVEYKSYKDALRNHGRSGNYIKRRLKNDNFKDTYYVKTKEKNTVRSTYID